MAIGIGAMSLVGILLQSLYYGVFLVLFLYNLYLQINDYKRSRWHTSKWLLFVASILLFCFITTHWCLDVARLYEAVILLGPKVPIDLYFANLPDPKQVATILMWEVEILTGDFILIYRLFHVYERKWWMCIIPACCWLAIATLCGFVAHSMLSVSLATGLFIAQVQRWISASFCLSLSINIYCTGLITWRLWRGHRNAARMGLSHMANALRIFVESAGFLAIWMLCTFILFQVGSNVQYVFFDTLGPTVGISFTLILVRLGMYERGEGVVLGGVRPFRSTGTDTSSSRYPLSSINISVSKDVDTDLESMKVDKRSTSSMIR